MKKYRISKEAIRDINTIWLYTFKKWPKAQADRYYQLIIDEIEFTSENYYTGKSLDNTRKNYSYSSVKSHLVFYRKQENHPIEIIRVLHQKMDKKKHLK
jgi:toxin ParE1/3/4